MPELSEEMYCSQQICIPPLYPYLLRQYAKAAIRSQPSDLLKWSTAYFRCLSLNIPPPIKPRLEYPIPRDYCGITPGWLKTLLNQLQNNQTVSFKVLWDRWIGACLQHDCLIRILCLGGFTDNMAISLTHFLALCVAHLTENLTQTMILICELFTEEPEGGSAMITLELFLDLYQFLTNLDASKPQWLKNLYFTDKVLGLIDEEIKEKTKQKEIKEKLQDDVRSESSLSTTKSEVTLSKKETISEISCPSFCVDDNNLPPVEEYLKLLSDSQQFGEDGADITDILMEKAKLSPIKTDRKDQDKSESEPLMNTEKTIDGDKQSLEDGDIDKLSEKELEIGSETSVNTQQENNNNNLKDKMDDGDDVNKSGEPTDEKTIKSSDEDKIAQKSSASAEDEKTDAEVNVEKLSSINAEKSDEGLISQATIDDYIGMDLDGELADREAYLKQIETNGNFNEEMDYRNEGISQRKSSEIKEKIKKDYEEIYVDIIPGIGQKLPENLIKLLCDFMRQESINQHGMVMPRNIRHYKCPPLEILDY